MCTLPSVGCLFGIMNLHSAFWTLKITTYVMHSIHYWICYQYIIHPFDVVDVSVLNYKFLQKYCYMEADVIIVVLLV